VTIGEVAYHQPLELLLKFSEYGLDMPFNFRLSIAPLTKAFLTGFIKAYDETLGDKAQPNYSFGNHDVLRGMRLGEAGARMAAVLLLTLRGTPFIYYGEELGMENVDVPPERRQDPFVSYESGGNRDTNRTPMQWTPGPFAGFSTIEPWLPLGPNYATLNVEVEQQNPNSMLMLYKRLIELRQAHPALHRGPMQVLEHDGDIYGYTRTANDDQALILLNLGDVEEEIDLPDGDWTLAISTHHAQSGIATQSPLQLQSREGVVLVRKS
jgi:alpha-glucosidase